MPLAWSSALAGSLLLLMIEKRSGSIPPDIGKRIAALRPTQMDRVGLRVLDARRIEDLFSR